MNTTDLAIPRKPTGRFAEQPPYDPAEPDFSGDVGDKDPEKEPEVTPEERKIIQAYLKKHPVSSQNVLDYYHQATEGEVEAGRDWYPQAHRIARAMGRRYGVSTKQAAGIIAVYSPQKRWGRNIVEAHSVLRTGKPVGGKGAHINIDTTPDDEFVEENVGVMATEGQRNRAKKILAGEKSVQEVLSGKRNKSGTLQPKGIKIRAFAALIAHGGQPPEDSETEGRVVIDRHAAGVARGIRLSEKDYTVAGPTSSRTKFQPYSQAYWDASETLSEEEGRTVPPEEVQATTWLVQQRLSLDDVSWAQARSMGLSDRKLAEGYFEQYGPKVRSLMGSRAMTGYAELSKTEQAKELFDLAWDASEHPRSPETGRFISTSGVSAPYSFGTPSVDDYIGPEEMTKTTSQMESGTIITADMDNDWGSLQPGPLSKVASDDWVDTKRGYCYTDEDLQAKLEQFADALAVQEPASHSGGSDTPTARGAPDDIPGWAQEAFYRPEDTVADLPDGWQQVDPFTAWAPDKVTGNIGPGTPYIQAQVDSVRQKGRLPALIFRSSRGDVVTVEQHVPDKRPPHDEVRKFVESADRAVKWADTPNTTIGDSRVHFNVPDVWVQETTAMAYVVFGDQLTVNANRRVLDTSEQDFYAQSNIDSLEDRAQFTETFFSGDTEDRQTYLLAHELGHIEHNRSHDLSNDTEPKRDPQIKDAEEEFFDSEMWSGAKISTYGHEGGPFESYAEAFASYTVGSNSDTIMGRIPTPVMEYAQRYGWEG